MTYFMIEVTTLTNFMGCSLLAQERCMPQPFWFKRTTHITATSTTSTTNDDTNKRYLYRA